MAILKLRHAYPVSTLVAPVWALILLSAAAGEGGPNADTMRRGQEVRERLSNGSPVHVLAFGDSITAGWGTDNRHVFHRMFVDCLRFRFPDCDLRYSVLGTSGQTTGEALRVLGRGVTTQAPDIVLAQFGGNDMGRGRRLRHFRADYAKLLKRLTEETTALVIACLPPIVAASPDNPWSKTARDTATEAGVAVADLDLALRKDVGDMRGPFPCDSHPGDFAHVAMARSVLGAFDAATGAEPVLRCRLVRGSVRSADGAYDVKAELTNPTDRPVSWSATIDFGQEKRTQRGSLGGGESYLLTQRFEVPAELPAGRAFRIPVRLYVRTDDYGTFDVAFLAKAPAVSAVPAANDAKLARDDGWHEISGPALTLNPHLWMGPQDVHGRFRVAVSKSQLRFEIRLTDDEVTVADMSLPWNGDSVELYLDLRPPEHQGNPAYTSGVLALQVIPPGDATGKTLWRNMDPLPEDLKGIAVDAGLTLDGYDVRVDLPLDAVKARRGDEWGGIGFAIGINDADDGGGRKTQMMWGGTADNYVTPAYLVGLYHTPVPTTATRCTLR